MNKLIAITKNTFIETLRQPVYTIIISASILLFILAPSVSMYTMDDDNKMLRELGLSTLFLTGLFIAIFSASAAVSEEMENKMPVLILTKPVKRPIFILSKFLGVSLAVLFAHYLSTIALLMSIRHGVIETASDTHDWTVIIAATAVIGITFLLTIFFNYIYDWNFSSTAIIVGSILATLAVIFLSFIDRDLHFDPKNNGFNAFDIYASLLLFFAIIIIVALALALSTRLNMMMTLICCIGVFLLGLISDYVFGRFVDTYIWAKIGRILVPSLQVFWVSDAIYEGTPVEPQYILIAASYAICYTAGIILLAIALFQSREIK